MTYVIKFDNGSYNQKGGFEVGLEEATRYETLEAAQEEAEGLWGVGDIVDDHIVNVGVHETHCCVDHGCKYGDEDCPVASGQLKQLYPCEECREEDPKDKATRELIKLAQDLVDLRDYDASAAEYEDIVRKMQPHLFIIKHGHKYPGRFK